MYQRLLVDRNRDWLPKIEALSAAPGPRVRRGRRRPPRRARRPARDAQGERLRNRTALGRSRWV